MITGTLTTKSHATRCHALPSALDLTPLLALLRWVSPTLPVGAYAYSRGLEHAVHAGWVHDEASALTWIAGLLRHGL